MKSITDKYSNTKTETLGLIGTLNGEGRIAYIPTGPVDPLLSLNLYDVESFNSAKTLLRSYALHREITISELKLKRGQFVISTECLKKLFGLKSNRKVKEFLNLLNSDGLITADIGIELIRITFTDYDNFLNN
ncbi:MAG: hypothetical protein WCA84_16315 [Ignavibacteriaceae bacterium]